MTGSSAIANPTITIDAGDSLGDVNPMRLGQVVQDTDPNAVKSPDLPPTPDSIRRLSIDRANGMWDPIVKTSSPNALAKLQGLKPGVIRYFLGREPNAMDWKQTIGPIADRSGQRAFGLMEFLQVCEEVGAEPNITFHDSLFCEPVGGRSASDKAHLVEFLNAPAVAGNYWALKRAEYGHPEPYDVKYFEIGNECWTHTDYLAGESGTMTPEQYVIYASGTIDAMKAVDGGIECGIVLRNYGYAIDSTWNRVVLSGLHDKADFAVTHTYAIAYYKDGGDDNQALMMNATLSSTDQIELWVDQLQDYIKDVTGKELPLAVTEYNALFVQYNPIPFRFTYGSALFSADMLRVWLQPSKKILMANYWHYIGSYWGMIQGDTDATLTERPAYPLFALWTEHFGDEIVATQVQNSPTITCDGFLRAAPSQGDGEVIFGGPIVDNLVSTNKSQLLSPSGTGYTIAAGQSEDIIVQAKLDNLTENAFPALIGSTPVTSGAHDYLLSYEARLVNPVLTGPTRFGLSLGDERGYGQTQSIAFIDSLNLTTSWTSHEVVYTPLSDTAGLELRARLLCQDSTTNGTANGWVEFRYIKITPRNVAGAPIDDNIITTLQSPSGTGYTVTTSLSTDIIGKAKLTNLTANAYPTLITSMPVTPGATNYLLSYEARLVNPANTGAPTFGLGLGDALGWSQTQSAAGIDNANLTTDWTLQEKMYSPLETTTGLELRARLLCQDDNANGSVEFRDIRVTPYGPDGRPLAGNLVTDIDSSDWKNPSKTGYTVTSDHRTNITVLAKLDNLTIDRFPKLSGPLGSIPITSGATNYLLSYEARLVSPVLTGTTSFGLSMGDERGWSQTRPIAYVDSPNLTTDWSSHQAVYTPLSDTAGLELRARLLCNGGTASGWVEFRNVKITPRNGNMDPMEDNIIPTPLESPSDTDYTVTSSQSTDVFVQAKLSNLAADEYPTLINPISVPSAAGKYRLSYEARLVNPVLTETTRFGLGVGDARGWTETESAAGIDNLDLTTDWTYQEIMYTALPDTIELMLQARLRCQDGTANGTVEFRNIKIEPHIPPLFPAYNALTACSSLSDDGKTLYVIIFNKDADNSVTTDIDLQNFNISGPGQMWQVTSTNGLTATNIDALEVTQSATALTINPGGTPQFPLTLPPASMTACEFTRP